MKQVRRKRQFTKILRRSVNINGDEFASAIVRFRCKLRSRIYDLPSSLEKVSATSAGILGFICLPFLTAELALDKRYQFLG